MKILLLSLALSLFTSTPMWNTDFDQAKVEASKSHKNILISFSGSDWCVPCIKMEKQIFEADQFTSYATKDLVLVKADFPRLKKNKLSKEQTKLNEQLAEAYNPHGNFPYTVLVDEGGKVLKVWDGLPASNASQFVEEIKSFARLK